MQHETSLYGRRVGIWYDASTEGTLNTPQMTVYSCQDRRLHDLLISKPVTGYRLLPF